MKKYRKRKVKSKTICNECYVCFKLVVKQVFGGGGALFAVVFSFLDVSQRDHKIPDIIYERYVILIENLTRDITKKCLEEFLETFCEVHDVVLNETTNLNYAHVV